MRPVPPIQPTLPDPLPPMPPPVEWDDVDGRLRQWEEARSAATLRDQFAMAALTGILARTGVASHAGLADECWRVADAMLAAREGGVR